MSEGKSFHIHAPVMGKCNVHSRRSDTGSNSLSEVIGRNVRGVRELPKAQW